MLLWTKFTYNRREMYGFPHFPLYNNKYNIYIINKEGADIMKLTIKQSIINEQLNYIIKGISSKNIIPILHCIKLSLKEEGLYLLSTDNDITIQSFIPVEKIERVIELGDIVVPGKLFSDIIRALDNSIIKIEELVDAQLSVETESSSFLVSCNNAYEYPEIDLNETKSPIYISKKIFKSTINQTIFATATSELKPVLTGINFKFEKIGRAHV